MATTFPPFDGSAPKTQQFAEPPEMGIDPAKRYTATLDTSLGELVIALDAVKAPKTVNNFVFLALHHYWHGPHVWTQMCAHKCACAQARCSPN